MLGNEASVPVGDSGGPPVAAARIFYITRSAEADNGVPDRVAWLACGAVDDVGRVTLPSDSTDCTVGEGDFHASAAAAIG